MTLDAVRILQIWRAELVQTMPVEGAGYLYSLHRNRVDAIDAALARLREPEGKPLNLTRLFKQAARDERLTDAEVRNIVNTLSERRTGGRADAE